MIPINTWPASLSKNKKPWTCHWDSIHDPKTRTQSSAVNAVAGLDMRYKQKAALSSPVMDSKKTRKPMESIPVLSTKRSSVFLFVFLLLDRCS